MCETTDVTTMGDGAEVKTLKIRDCSDGTCQNEYLIEELQAQLAAANARIAELEAQAKAVPVDAIAYHFRPYSEIRLSLRFDAGDKVRAWLKTVQP